MRQLLIQVNRGSGDEVLKAAGSARGANLSRWEARGPDGPEDVVLVHVPNPGVGGLLDGIRDLPGLRATLLPTGVVSLRQPLGEAAGQTTRVGPRSPLEVYLGGLQSVGSWTAFLAYAAASGVVAWIGLYANTVYLLTAAMLLAPFAGPAMNASLATARGDAPLLGRSLLRYFAGLAVAAAAAFLLSLAAGQRVATSQMKDIADISAVAVLLPLVAGAAGALSLVTAERNSLVSGAAVGVLVAASLAPPAGVAGMAAAPGDWGMVRSGAFLVLLQVAGINVAGSAVFRLAGLSPGSGVLARGRPWIFPAASVAAALAVAGLLAWQFSDGPALLRSTVEQRAHADIRDAVEADGTARLVRAEVRFTRADTPGQATLLAVVRVRPVPGTPDDGGLRSRLSDAVQAILVRRHPGVVPLVDLTVLTPPPAGHRADGRKPPAVAGAPVACVPIRAGPAHSSEASPVRTANFTRSTTLWMSSFSMMLRRWVSTVAALMCRARPIWTLDLPSATWRSTSRSRADRQPGGSPPESGRPRTQLSTTTAAAAGLR
jgi:uncharacterized hydrophobic protein (TIGR00271 family)